MLAGGLWPASQFVSRLRHGDSRRGPSTCAVPRSRMFSRPGRNVCVRHFRMLGASSWVPLRAARFTSAIPISRGIARFRADVVQNTILSRPSSARGCRFYRPPLKAWLEQTRRYLPRATASMWFVSASVLSIQVFQRQKASSRTPRCSALQVCVQGAEEREALTCMHRSWPRPRPGHFRSARGVSVGALPAPSSCHAQLSAPLCGAATQGRTPIEPFYSVHDPGQPKSVPCG